MSADLNCTDTKLHQLVRLMGRHYDAELVKVGLRTTQFWLLTEVLQNGPARPCDLAKAMALEPSTLTRKLKPLVATGWLEFAVGADRRTRSVCITSSGRIKRAEGLRRWQAAEEHVRGLLGAENVNRLDASLSKASKQFRRQGERTQALAGRTQRVHPRCGQKGVWRRHASREECASRYGLRSRNVSAMHALLNPQGSTNGSQFGVQTTGTTSLHRLLAQSDGEASAARADGQRVDAGQAELLTSAAAPMVSRVGVAQTIRSRPPPACARRARRSPDPRPSSWLRRQGACKLPVANIRNT